MDSLFILIPIALVFVVIAIKGFIWAVNSRQYDDLDAAGKSILFEDDVKVTVSKNLKPEEKPAGLTPTDQTPTDQTDTDA